VGANETLRQRFASEGEYIGICTVHPSGQIVVTVQ
jgi:plastocyanin